MSLDPRCGVVEHACHDTDTDKEERWADGGVVHGEAPVLKDVLIIGGGCTGLELGRAFLHLRQEPPPILVLDSPPCVPMWPRDLNFAFKLEPDAMKAAGSFFKRLARKRRR